MQSSYQEEHFTEIADAIRYVDGTEKAEDMIVALDFAKRIRALKRLIVEGGGWAADGMNLTIKSEAGAKYIRLRAGKKAARRSARKKNIFSPSQGIGRW